MYKNDLNTKYWKVPVKISTVKSAVFIKDAMFFFDREKNGQNIARSRNMM